MAPCSAMNRKLPMSTIQKIRDLYKTRKYKQAYLASIYGVSSAQISRIVNLKRRQFVGNEEIAFADEQKQNAHEEIAFPDCGRGAKEVLLPPSLECTSGIRCLIDPTGKIVVSVIGDEVSRVLCTCRFRVWAQAHRQHGPPNCGRNGSGGFGPAGDP